MANQAVAYKLVEFLKVTLVFQTLYVRHFSIIAAELTGDGSLATVHHVDFHAQFIEPLFTVKGTKFSFRVTVKLVIDKLILRHHFVSHFTIFSGAFEHDFGHHFSQHSVNFEVPRTCLVHE